LSVAGCLLIQGLTPELLGEFFGTTEQAAENSDAPVLCRRLKPARDGQKKQLIGTTKSRALLQTVQSGVFRSR
jgi:hypothetical protein